MWVSQEKRHAFNLVVLDCKGQGCDTPPFFIFTAQVGVVKEHASYHEIIVKDSVLEGTSLQIVTKIHINAWDAQQLLSHRVTLVAHSQYQGGLTEPVFVVEALQLDGWVGVQHADTLSVVMDSSPM